MKHSTNLVIISGPSGAGKDSVIDGIANRGVRVERVITSTTREPRPGESEGKPYYFLSRETMLSKIQRGEMAEHAQVYENLYGVTKKELARAQQSQKNAIAIWRVDEQGVRAIRKSYPDALFIGITAPAEDLLKRTEGRGDQQEQIKKRMASTKEWTGEDGLYDYKIENHEGKLDEAIDETIEILKKEGLLTKPADSDSI
ncbi:MAG: hypothetical protein U1C18_00200 [Patescibacteria group bacterium]|nr:hypothetical protein [bacterium]MDZ4221277.1 hypothetical protein [Patescibacteria group bacterium]